MKNMKKYYKLLLREFKWINKRTEKDGTQQ